MEHRDAVEFPFHLLWSAHVTVYTAMITEPELGMDICLLSSSQLPNLVFANCPGGLIKEKGDRESQIPVGETVMLKKQILVGILWTWPLSSWDP